MTIYLLVAIVRFGVADVFAVIGLEFGVLGILVFGVC